MALYHSARGSVGYTIVGTPTIVNGVAKDFSLDNYLSLNSTITSFTELSISFIPGTYSSGRIVLFKTGVNAYRGSLNWAANSTARFTYTNTSNDAGDLTNIPYTEGKENILKIEYVSTNSVKLTLSRQGESDFIRTITDIDIPATFGGDIYFGRGTSDYSSFNGSIDLNKTYIIDNGQPFFGICPIEVKEVSLNNNTVKYIIKDGKLIWADPKLYLLNSGRAYINTGVPSNAVTQYKIDYRITDSSIRIMAFGADISFRNKSDTFIGIANSGLYWYYGTGDSAYHVLLSKSSEYFLQKNRLEVNYSSTSATGSIYNNTEQISSYTTTASELSSNTYYLFGLNRNGTATLDGSLRIYSAQYYGSNINKYLVPVPQGLQIGSFTVPSNGMFDIVNQQFYGNQGAGQFIIGRDE